MGAICYFAFPLLCNTGRQEDNAVKIDDIVTFLLHAVRYGTENLIGIVPIDRVERPCLPRLASEGICYPGLGRTNPSHCP